MKGKKLCWKGKVIVYYVAQLHTYKGDNITGIDHN